MYNNIMLDRNRPRQVVFYGRVSTDHEAQLSALENQIQWYEDQRKYHPNWNVVDRYIDEGITGTQAKKRPSFLRMIEDARSGKFDLIVTREVCRFARNTVDTLSFTRELRNIGVEVFFVEDNIWTMDGDGELRLSLMATLAQDESRKVSERVRAGQLVSREKNRLYGNGNILGYNKVGDTYVIDPDQAETVRMIFDLYIQGLGSRKIGDELTRLQYRNASGVVKWDSGNIIRIIRNATYMGRVVYNKSHSNNYLDQRRIVNTDEDTYIIGEKKFDAIIDEDVWYKANAIRKSKKKPTLVVGGTVLRSRCNPSTNMWTNKLICSCGSGFRRDLWGKNKAGVPSWGYRCYNKLNHGSARTRREAGLDTTDFCDMKMLPQWRLDLIAEHIFDDIFVNRRKAFAKALELVKKYYRPDAQSPEEQKSDTEILAEIKALENKIGNLIDMRAEGILSKEEFTKRHSKTKNEIDEKRKLLTAPSEAAAKDNAEMFNKSICNIEQTLHAMSDFKGGASAAFMDKIIDSVQVVDPNSYIFNIRYNENYKGAIKGTANGRHNKAVVNIDEISGSPDGESVSHNKGNTCLPRQPYRLQLLTRSNSEIYSDWLFYAESGRC